MADDDTPQTGEPVDQQVVGEELAATETNEQGTPADGGTPTDDSFLLSYRTREDAEKAYLEKDKTIARFAQEKDELARKVERLQTETLERLTKLATDNDSDKPTKKEAANLDELKARIREDPANTMEIVSAWSQDLDGNLRKYADDKLAGVLTQIEKVSERVTKSSPEYVKNREMVEELRTDYGMPLDKALEFAAKHGKRGPSQPNAPQPPGTPKGPSKVKTETKPAFDAATIAGLRQRNPDITDDEIKTLAEMEAARKGRK